MSKILRDIPIEKQIMRHMTWLEAHRADWERQTTASSTRPTPKLGPYISISRELGSGGTEIAQKLAEKIGWQYFDREIIEAIATRSHVREEVVARFDEHIRSEWDTYFFNLLTFQLLNNTHYLHHLTEVLLGIAQCGKAVLVGRGANFILPPECGLRVRMVAPIEFRIRQLTTRENYDEKSAKLKIKEHDKAHQAFFEHHFRCSSSDPCAYDTVINTSSLALETVVDIIIRLANEKLKIAL